MIYYTTDDLCHINFTKCNCRFIIHNFVKYRIKTFYKINRNKILSKPLWIRRKFVKANCRVMNCYNENREKENV